MQALQPKPPRGVPVGIAVELFGIAFAVFGLSLQYTTGGPTTTGNPLIAGLGAWIVFVGLILHIWRA